MKRLLSAFILSIALVPQSAVAQDLPKFGDESRLGLQFNLFDATRMLGEMIQRGHSFIRDHLEIQGRYREDPFKDDVKGEMQLKVYPHGKQEPEDCMTGQGTFELLRRPGELRFHFDVNISPGLKAQPGEEHL